MYTLSHLEVGGVGVIIVVVVENALHTPHETRFLASGVLLSNRRRTASGESHRLVLRKYLFCLDRRSYEMFSYVLLNVLDKRRGYLAMNDRLNLFDDPGNNCLFNNSLSGDHTRTRRGNSLVHVLLDNPDLGCVNVAVDDGLHFDNLLWACSLLNNSRTDMSLDNWRIDS